MKVSILISTYNGEKDIRLLLDSIQNLERKSYDLEVIIRDDSSSDATVHIIEQEYGWVNLIQGKGGNAGFVKSNNIAFQQATGEIICCVNQDTILHPKFVVEGVRALQQDPQIFGVNTNMIMPWILSVEEFSEKNQKEIPAYEYQLTPFGFVRYVAVEKDTRRANFMTGGGFFVRRSVLPEKYIFDPAIDMYCEDTELSLRLQDHGGIIMYVPGAIIYHNQAVRKTSTLREFVQLIKITRNRFALFARINDPVSYMLKYPLYLIGIILKMSYLGLSRFKQLCAYGAGAGVFFLFLILFPYWLLYASYSLMVTGKSRDLY